MNTYKVIGKQNNSSDCIICGINNQLGLQARFYILENNKLASYVLFKSEHQSYPGRVHGGMIGALLDEILGRAVQIHNINNWGVTVKLAVEYKKPVPYNTKLISVGWVDLPIRHLFTGGAYIADLNGNILATATATYFKLSSEDITPGGLTHTNWFTIDNEEDPTTFTIPE